MQVRLLYVPGCPNLDVARERVRQAAAVLGLTPVVREQTVTTQDEAEALGFVGSPTVLVDGDDVVPVRTAVPSLACRLYRTVGRTEGAPTVEDIALAMQKRA
jgi:hypothetical protein